MEHGISRLLQMVQNFSIIWVGMGKKEQDWVSHFFKKFSVVETKPYKLIFWTKIWVFNTNGKMP